MYHFKAILKNTVWGPPSCFIESHSISPLTTSPGPHGFVCVGPKIPLMDILGSEREHIIPFSLAEELVAYYSMDAETTLFTGDTFC